MAYVIIRKQSSLSSSSSRRAIKYIWWSDSLTYCPTLGLSRLMCSLAPISQPQALPINPRWLLIGAEGDTQGLSQAVRRNLPSSSRLIYSHASALWLVTWNPLGWKALVASLQIYQDHPSSQYSCYTHNQSPGIFTAQRVIYHATVSQSLSANRVPYSILINCQISEHLTLTQEVNAIC